MADDVCILKDKFNILMNVHMIHILTEMGLGMFGSCYSGRWMMCVLIFDCDVVVENMGEKMTFI